MWYFLMNYDESGHAIMFVKTNGKYILIMLGWNIFQTIRRSNDGRYEKQYSSFV